VYIKSGACRTHVVHVLAFGTSRNSIFPLSSPLARTLGSSSFVFDFNFCARRSRVFYRATVPIYARSRPYPVSLLLVIFPLSPASCPRPSRTSHLVSNVSFATRVSSQEHPSPTSTSNLISPSSDHNFARTHIRVDWYLRAYSTRSFLAKDRLLFVVCPC